MSGRWEAPRFEVLRTFADIAAETKRPLRAIQRQLVAVHRADESKGCGGWLFRAGRGKWLVNASRLRDTHPEFFEVKYFSRAEAEVLIDDVNALRNAVKDQARALTSTRARLRELLQLQKSATA